MAETGHSRKERRRGHRLSRDDHLPDRRGPRRTARASRCDGSTRPLSPSPPSRRESFGHIRRRQPGLLARTDRCLVACRGHSPARARQREGKRVASLGCLCRRTSQGRRRQSGGGCAGRHRPPGEGTGARAGAVLLRRALRLSLPAGAGRDETFSSLLLRASLRREVRCLRTLLRLPPTHGGHHADAPLTPLARRETRESATTSHRAAPGAGRWPQSPRRAAHDDVPAKGSPPSVRTAPDRAHRHHRR